MDFNLIIHSKKFNVNDNILKLICHENNVDFIVKSNKNNWNFILSQNNTKIKKFNNKYLMQKGFFYENLDLENKNFSKLNGQFAITLIENISSNTEIHIITDFILSKPIYYYFTKEMYFFTTNKNFNFFKLNKMENASFWKFSEKKFIKYQTNTNPKTIISNKDPETLYNIYSKFNNFEIFYKDISNCVNHNDNIGILYENNFNSSILIYILIKYHIENNLDINKITIIQISDINEESIPNIINFLENTFSIQLNFHYINKNVQYNKKFDTLFTSHFLNEIFLNENFNFLQLENFEKFSNNIIPLFLNKTFVEYINSLDKTLKQQNYYDINKPPINLYILRKAFEEILPKEILYQ